MDFCYVWLRRLIGGNRSAFKKISTRDQNELTGNVTMERGLNHFTQGLSSVYQRMAGALKSGAPLAFTYHHNKLEAYYPVAVAILNSGLTCSASLPCPAEMSSSIHINGTASSIIDTIFVCRSTGRVPRHWLPEDPEGLAALVQEDVHQLQIGGVKPTWGDVRCVLFGHLIRLAIWSLRTDWDRDRSADEQLASLACWIEKFGGTALVEKHLTDVLEHAPRVRSSAIHESQSSYETEHAEVFFTRIRSSTGFLHSG